MSDHKHKTDLNELIRHAMDCMGAAATIIDAGGTLLYYNRQAATILDRKPQYIGTDIHSHHKKTDSNQKVDLMLKAFKEGRKEPFLYKAKPYGKTLFVTFAPIVVKGEFVGCVQTVRLEQETERG